MSNMQKAFKKKSSLRCMADGGEVDPRLRPDDLGTGAASQAAQLLQNAEATTRSNLDAMERGDDPPTSGSSRLTPSDPMPPRKQQNPGMANGGSLRRFFAKADGGTVRKPAVSVSNSGQAAAPSQAVNEGGHVQGPGGPTDDKVGPVMLSDGEYVLPADTVDHIGKENLDAIRSATHKPVKKFADGGLVDDRQSQLRQPPMAGGPASPGAAAALGLIDTLKNSAGNMIDQAKSLLPGQGTQPAASMPMGQPLTNQTTPGAQALRLQAANPPATSTAPSPVQPSTYQSTRLAEMGVPVDQQGQAPLTEPARQSLLRSGVGTPGKYSNLGTYGGDGNIYGTASKPGGRVDTFVGVGAKASPNGPADQPEENPLIGDIRSALRNSGGGGVGGGGSNISSNASEINARYDKLAKQLSSGYSAKGQGNLSRHLLELEQQRNSALTEDQRTQSSLRGQDISANSAAANNRNQLLQTAASLANNQNTNSREMMQAQFKALQDAQTAAKTGEEKGFGRYTQAISSMFVDPTTGKPDTAEQEKFTSFLQASDPRAAEKFSAMQPQEQMNLLQNFRTLYDMNKARNTAATSGLLNFGATTNRADLPKDVREATWDDVVNKHLPLSDYVRSNLPFTNPNVVEMESGQPVLMSKAAVDNNGNWDADKLELIRQRTGKDKRGKSTLRGN